MALAFMLNRLKALFLILLGVVKRALCCFRRRRRTSCDPIPLTAVGVIPNKDSSAIEDRTVPELQSWNTWDDSPSSVVTEHSQHNAVQQQIEQYRQKARLSSETEGEPQPDFFQDMTPRITKQTKILLKKENDSTGWNEPVSSRLTLAVDAVAFPSPELETWEDTPGWEDQTREDWDPDAILREKRRLERQQRQAEQQQKRQEREPIKLGRPISLGARNS